MSSERERRKAETRLRQKKHRAKAVAEREQRTERERARRKAADGAPVEKTSLAEASSWPAKDAWVSEDWEERGAVLHAGASRAHADGRFAAVFFTLDTKTGEVSDLVRLAGVPEGAVNQAVVDRAGTKAMVFCAHADVASLAGAAARWAKSHKVALPAGFEEVTRFLHDAPIEEADVSVEIGDPAEEEDTQEIVMPNQGFVASIKRMFGF